MNGIKSRSSKRDDNGHQSHKRAHSKEDPSDSSKKHRSASHKHQGSDHNDDSQRKRLLLKDARDLTKPSLINSKESHKKLSFFAGNENESDNEDEVDVKHSPNGSLKRASQTTQQTSSNGGDCKNQSVERVVHIADHKIATAVESDHDDASSTSSCSCEDHSSVEDGSENPHGDLDYDEDSISGSPKPDSPSNKQEERNASSPALAISNAGSNTSVSVAKNETTSDSTVDTVNHDTIDPTTSQKEERKLQIEEQESSDESNTAEQTTRPARIRSFINFDHNKSNPTVNKEETSPRRSKKDKSHKSYEHLLKYFLKDACYFQIKSINHENVEISKSMGLWSTPIQNEIKLNAAFRDHRNVILVFSVQQSGAFQGFARMVSESQPNDRRMPWVLPERFNVKSLGGLFQVEWLCTKELSFNDTRDLCNPYNNSKPIKIARDGQQVEPSVGKKLCNLFPQDSKRRLLQAIDTLKRQNRLRKQGFHYGRRVDDIYALDDPRSMHHNYYPRASLGPFIPPHHFDIEDMNSASHIGRIYDDFYPPAPIGMRRRDQQPLPNTEFMMREMHHQRLGLYPSHPQPHPCPSPREFDGATVNMRSSGMNHYHIQPPLSRAHVGDALQSDQHHFAFDTYPTAARPFYETWMVSSEMSRYHPYQRTRR